jgi:hypothetical protein
MSKKNAIQSSALAVLMLICGALWYRNANSAGASSDHEVKSGAAYKPMSVENPQIHWDLLTDLQQTQYETTGRDIFNWHLPAPPPPPTIHVPGPGDADFQPPPPPPPPPPQLPLKFFGVSTDSKGSARRAFLTDGSDVYIVAEGDSVLGRYRVRRITNANLEFEEIGSGRRALKPLEEQTPSK